MLSKICGILVLFFISTYSIAQDSISQSLFPDSLMDGDQEESKDYMVDGYYDKVPFFNNIPNIDTALFSSLSDKYKAQEFDYNNDNIEQIGFFEKIFDRIGRWLRNLFPDTEYFRFADVFYDILALLAVVLLVWIIYRVIFSGKRLLGPNEQQESGQEEMRFVEKNLLDIDLLSYIDQAKQQDDFVKAIRYLNLLNIQLLARKGYIEWHYSKSHVELIEEIDDSELKREFSRNVNVFNRVWYGNEQVDKMKYESFAKYFLDFQKKWE